jgi:polar amino acid transport system substrate-binding protein
LNCHGFRTLSLLLLAGLAGGSLGCGGRSTNTLLWGADAEGGAPYVYKDTVTGKYAGFEVDLAEALSKELGRPIEFTQYDFKMLIKGLERGDIDLAMNGLEVTEDRKAVVRFSRPYYVYKQQLVVRADDDRFQSFNDLKGRKEVKAATLANTAAWRLLQQHEIPTEVYDDQVNPYKDLDLKRVDAVLLDLPIAIYVVKKNAELNRKLRFAGPPIEPGHYAIALRKNDTALADQIDQALGRLIAGGELKRIYDKWELWTEDQDKLADR